MKYKAAIVQLTSTPDINHNFQQSKQLIENAVNKGASFIALPENFACMDEENEKVKRINEIYTYGLEFLLNASSQHNVFVLGGGLPFPDPSGKTYNRSLLVGPSGILATYDKIHLFDAFLPNHVYCESATTQHGYTPVVFTSKTLGVLGFSICYDLRFPELYRKLANKGAKAIVVPAAFTATTGKDHWKPLLQARAIENTCYIIAPAQCGKHYPGRKTYGHSMIIDPWGKILVELDEAPGIGIAEITKERLDQVRSSLPSLSHQRLYTVTG